MNKTQYMLSKIREHGYTDLEISKELGVSRAHISKLRYGVHLPSTNLLELIENLFNEISNEEIGEKGIKIYETENYIEEHSNISLGNIIITIVIFSAIVLISIKSRVILGKSISITALPVSS